MCVGGIRFKNFFAFAAYTDRLWYAGKKIDRCHIIIIIHNK